MKPEEMDVIELVGEVSLEPAWILKPESAIRALAAGSRGMIVHRDPDGGRYDVEFVDPASTEPLALVPLKADQFRVVERYTVEGP